MNLNDEPRHPIQVVSRRTGLSADVIRAWERRYHAVAPSRSSTRRRLYSEADVERLLLLRKATLAGRRIGDVAALSSAELVPLVREDADAEARAPVAAVEPEPTPNLGAHLEACLEPLHRLDAVTLEERLSQAARDLGTDALLNEVLMPLLRRVGEGWAEGSMTIGHEHMATALVRTLLDAMRVSFSKRFPGPEILVCTPEGEVHELGALMVAVVAASEGWRVSYLGTDLPAEELAAVAKRREAQVIALSVVYPDESPAVLRELGTLHDLLPSDATVIVGGRAAASYGPHLSRLGMIRLAGIDELRGVLGRLQVQPRATG
jgi:methanogenic corrinoid protein MtbC1